jgi:lantibiotic modifying enzyme
VNTELLEVAERIGARLCRDAWWSGGCCNWTGEFGEEDATAYGSLGPHLYQGTAGIALFLWRLAEATGEQIFRITAHGALRQALSKLPQPGCGLYSGGLGIHYAAWKIRGECDEDAVLRQMLQEAAPEPTNLDVMSGSAGAIPALLLFHRERGGARWIEAAAAHGGQLLAEAMRSESGWSWPTVPGAPNLTGYSHGASGIGLALLELWRATGEPQFREGAMEAFRFERSLLDRTQGNWPDLRSDPAEFPVLWCHGAGGIGFSRLRAWQILRDDETLSDARIALATVENSLVRGRSFCLCHGIGGNADLLIYASQVLGEGRWLRAAQAAGEMGAERIERKNRPWASGLPTGNETPGLMVGLAGIGYFYLRLADPARTPTVLLGAIENEVERR